MNTDRYQLPRFAAPTAADEGEPVEAFDIDDVLNCAKCIGYAVTPVQIEQLLRDIARMVSYIKTQAVIDGAHAQRQRDAKRAAELRGAQQ